MPLVAGQLKRELLCGFSHEMVSNLGLRTDAPDFDAPLTFSGHLFTRLFTSGFDQFFVDIATIGNRLMN